MSSIKKSNRNLIMLLLGLVILLLAYFLVFNRMQDKADALESELETRQQLLTTLEEFDANKTEYLAGIEEGKNIVAEITGKVPANVRDEDYVLYLLDMEEKTGAKIDNISLDEKNVVSEFDCIIEDETKPVEGGEIYATVAAEMDYSQLKDALNFIYNNDDATYLDKLSVTYDSTTAKLDVISGISKLYLDYDGADSADRLMPHVALGVNDLFGSFEEEVVEEEADAEEVEEPAE